jgi:hypothetical protein
MIRVFMGVHAARYIRYIHLARTVLDDTDGEE